MPAVAALLDSRGTLTALRRTLPRGSAPVLACRGPTGLERALRSRLLDAIVLGTRAARAVDLGSIRARYPGIPLCVYGSFRSDDGRFLTELDGRVGIAAILVEGVDDPVAGEIIVRRSVSARRRRELAEAPRLFRLTEPLQCRAWELLLDSPGRPPTTETIAAKLEVSREHLSRQFGAGGAPNLKRVIDLLQVIAALDLLTNPGYPLALTSRLLGYSTPGHLRAVIRRIVGVPFAQFPAMNAAVVLKRFVGGRGRSRR
ncbi:MAG: AraC family transcriptional regulator [Gemmatimonadota bacterium]